ncbi:MAG: ArnT family glycosyltransferase [Candidatus Promineifilaceae bacterium]
MRKTLLLIGLILLLALAFRLYNLTGIPPGLTHDEANHSREAIEILDGVYRYYFPLNYGSEPLYSYTVAGTMALLGENLFALRLVNVIFGLAAIAATAVWARQAFNKETALIAAGLLAVSFWPLVSSREALRAGMLPFFMVLAVWFFWQIVCNPCGQDGDGPPASTPGRWRMAGLVIGFALSILATFHIYLAARVAWLLFPICMFYMAMM